MRRIALYSDIHANVHALDAVLADIAACGVTERYCLGDLVGYGAHPAEVIARVRATGDQIIGGNYDDGIGHRRGECGCYYATAEAKRDGAVSYAFTDAALDDDDRAFLRALLSEVRLEEGGVRVLLVHASPRRINEYLMPDRPDDNLEKLAGLGGTDVMCFGHVHLPYHRVVTGADGRALHFVSDGSVGKPKDGDSRACWTELVLGTKAEVNKAAEGDRAAGPAGASDGERTWVGAVFHRVAYDVEAAAADVLAAGLPARLAEALQTA